MSDTPSLLSEERLAEIIARSEKAMGFASQSQAMNDRADVLQHLAAYRQQVAVELARLLVLPSYGYLTGCTTDPQDDSMSSYDDESRAVAAGDYRDLIQAAAARLQIDLTLPA